MDKPSACSIQIQSIQSLKEIVDYYFKMPQEEWKQIHRSKIMTVVSKFEALNKFLTQEESSKLIQENADILETGKYESFVKVSANENLTLIHFNKLQEFPELERPSIKLFLVFDTPIKSHYKNEQLFLKKGKARFQFQWAKIRSLENFQNYLVDQSIDNLQKEELKLSQKNTKIEKQVVKQKQLIRTLMKDAFK